MRMNYERELSRRFRKRVTASTEILSQLKAGASSAQILEERTAIDPFRFHQERQKPEISAIIEDLEKSSYVDRVGLSLDDNEDKPDLELMLMNGVKVFIKLFHSAEERHGYIRRSPQRWNINRNDLNNQLARRKLLIIDISHSKGIRANFELLLFQIFPSMALSMKETLQKSKPVK